MLMIGGLGQSGSPLCALGAADYDDAIVLFLYIYIKSALLSVLDTGIEKEGGSNRLKALFFFFYQFSPKERPRFFG